MNATGSCHIGKVRKINQDNIFVSNENIGVLPNLYVVADGMGGHNAGEYASKFAIEYFIDYINSSDSTDDIDQLLKQGIEKVNRMIYNKSLEKKQFSGMGTTFLVSTIINNMMYIANVGDSRLYIYQNELKKITKDHSLIEEMMEKGRITKEEAKNHPKRNIITRAVGVEESVKVDVYKKDLADLEFILLCSDGLTNMIDEDDIGEAISNKGFSLEQKVEYLIEEANRMGGYDNISVILIKNKGVGEQMC